tara:strand:+ start:4424 stop:4795 length:372 start_codon:yes stop_codon:yes gene_type:complete
MAQRRKLYRTMQGRMVDIEKLRSANESVQAVGNMNVNARGDVLGKGGQIVTPKETVIRKYYEQPRGRVDDTPARAKPAPVNKVAPTPKAVETKKVATPKAAPKVEEKTVAPKKGIDEALDGIE